MAPKTKAKRLSRYMEPHRDCLYSKPQKASPKSLSLDLLKVCGQVYHEAALKPFSQSSFNYIGLPLGMDNVYGLRAFLDGLNNTQVRAIANMRISIEGELHNRTFARLSALEHLDVEILTEHDPIYGVIKRLENYARKAWIDEIGDIVQKSLRVSCDVEYYRTQPTEAEKKSIEDWVELAEAEWLEPPE